MFFKKIVGEGLSLNSFMIGDNGEVAVIDPRRDVQIYLDIANENGLEIKAILETHRHEDYVIGSMELGERSGATIYLSGHEDLGHVYGERLMDGDELDIGGVKIKALHTPGHTLGHLCYVVYEGEEETPYMVFTGDCLFTGDLGRTDFYGKDNLEKMTGLLYDSFYEKLLPLGEGVIVMPGHSAGSACGANMKEIPFTTLGYEARTNPELQVDSKEEFIEQFGRMRIKPRYFEAMEVYNVKGTEFVEPKNTIKPIPLEKAIEEGYTIIDSRSKEAHLGGHIPNSVYLSESNYSTFLGTLFPINEKIVLMADDDNMEKIMTLYWFGKRIGFDNVLGYVPAPVLSTVESEVELEKLPSINPADFLKLESEYVLLDIRKPEEFEEGDPEKNRVNIPLELLYKEHEKLNKDVMIYTMCGSGDRATTAASYLKSLGYKTGVIEGGILGLRYEMSK